MSVRPVAPGAAQGAASPDDLTGVEKGDGTFLNTKEWMFAGFFNRVKEAVASHWDPQGRLLTRDPHGLRYGTSDRVTILNVALGLDGRIQNIAVAQSCGLDFLDAEAVQAFQRAQPFPNPPARLATNGVIRFGFGFRITNNGALPPSMFRFNR